MRGHASQAENRRLQQLRRGVVHRNATDACVNIPLYNVNNTRSADNECLAGIKRMSDLRCVAIGEGDVRAECMTSVQNKQSRGDSRSLIEQSHQYRRAAIIMQQSVIELSWRAFK